MPLYQYYCGACDLDKERIVPIDARDSQRCEACGYAMVRAVVFNGAVYAPTSTSGGMKV